MCAVNGRAQPPVALDSATGRVNPHLNTWRGLTWNAGVSVAGCGGADMERLCMRGGDDEGVPLVSALGKRATSVTWSAQPG